MGNPAAAFPGLLKPTPDPFEQMAIDAKRDYDVMRHLSYWSHIIAREHPGKDRYKHVRKLNHARAFYGIEPLNRYR